MLASFGQNVNVVVVGASGGIGSALVQMLLEVPQVENVFTFSRRLLPSSLRHSPRLTDGIIDITDERSIEEAASSLQGHSIDLVIVATGLLHTEEVAPEKSIKTLTVDNFEAVFNINTLGPMLVAKHFLPLLTKERKSLFTALSARVSSISDNRLGGWYSYRASKAALNMMLKTLAIECSRTHPQSIISGLHPGTVNTSLSKPFQKQVKPEQLFSPASAAISLLQVIDSLVPEDSGKLFAWDGRVISP